jgi:hypothetical protein
MKQMLAAIATAALAFMLSMVLGAAAASVSFAVYQTERPSTLGSCPTANPVIAHGQSANFYGIATGAGILSDTICFTGPVGAPYSTDTITGGSWSLSSQGAVAGVAGIFCPSGTIRWDATGLRATVNARATVGAPPCRAGSPAMTLRGTWSRSPLSPNSSTFVGTLTLSY